MARLLKWEEMGIKGTNGKLKGFNSASWSYNMKNRFKEAGWDDKHQIEIEDLSRVSEERLAELTKSALLFFIPNESPT